MPSEEVLIKSVVKNKIKNSTRGLILLRTACYILSVSSILTMMGCHSGGSRYYSLDGVAQGTTFHMVFEPAIATDSSFEAIRDMVFSSLEKIDKAVSGYNKNSLLTAFNSGVGGHYDDSLANLYKIFLDNFLISKEMFTISDGAFDASAEPLFELWGFGFGSGREVTPRQIDSVMEFVGMNHFSIINEGSDSVTIIKDDNRCRLNFNAVAQGYTVDYIAEKFDSVGIKNYLIEVGGEIYARGVSERGTAWRIGVDKPADGNNSPGESLTAIINLSDKGLVTSGDYRKFYLKDGEKISHTINPATGYPVDHNLLSATILADDATTADAYATYLMVVGRERAQEVVNSTDGIEALLIYGTQDSMKVWMSEGLKKITEAEEN